MITKKEFEWACKRAVQMLTKAGIVLTPLEAERIEVADFGLNNLQCIGLELVTHINTARVCVKELVLFPCRTCPEHYHPPIAGELGKEETFRCSSGEVYLFVPGVQR